MTGKALRISFFLSVLSLRLINYLYPAVKAELTTIYLQFPYDRPIYSLKKYLLYLHHALVREGGITLCLLPIWGITDRKPKSSRHVDIGSTGSLESKSIYWFRLNRLKSKANPLILYSQTETLRDNSSSISHPAAFSTHDYRSFYYRLHPGTWGFLKASSQIRSFVKCLTIFCMFKPLLTTQGTLSRIKSSSLKAGVHQLSSATLLFQYLQKARNETFLIDNVIHNSALP